MDLPTPSKIVRQLGDLERGFWDAIQDQDHAAAASLSADPCVLVGPQGVRVVDRAALAEAVEKSPVAMRNYALDKLRVRQLTEDVVLVVYEVEQDLELEGQELLLEAYDASLWVRRAGQWECALHTETPAGDSWGRPASIQSGAVPREQSLESPGTV